jgi:hypothetical protein
MMLARSRGGGGDGSVRHDTRAADCPIVRVTIPMMMKAVMTKNGDRAAGMMQMMMMVKMFLVVRRGAAIGASLRRMGQWRVLTPHFIIFACLTRFGAVQAEAPQTPSAPEARDAVADVANGLGLRQLGEPPTPVFWGSLR